jgi:DeoR/GlpR family transcriptional regulator of sugar metabolism
MVKTAPQIILLADSNKFRALAFCDVCDLNQLAAVVTDKGISSDQRDKMEKLGPELTISQN